MYKFINSSKILPVSERTIKNSDILVYANEEDKPIQVYKKLVIEDKPFFDPKTERLHSWYEDGDVITQKFKVINLEEERRLEEELMKEEEVI